jgi:hypothetical protein
MAKSGILGQSKPAATTNTILYKAPIDKSASAVLTIANDGTGAAYDVALKDYDQNLVMDANTYLFHEGDVVTSHRFTLDQSLNTSSAITPGDSITSVDAEKKAKFHGFYIPEFTTINVKTADLTIITTESQSGDFNLGDVITKGTSPNATTAVLFDTYTSGGNRILIVGARTLNGTGTEFADGDSLSSASGGSTTVSTGGVAGSATNEFIFSSDASTYGFYSRVLSDFLLTFTADRAYRFDVSDSSMSGRSLKISATVNGEYGPDNDFTATGDNGVEYTDGKTTNGTAGSSGAYVQYNFAIGTPPAVLYWYDGDTTANGGVAYGGDDRGISIGTNFFYNEIYVYDIEGTWTNTDTFLVGDNSYQLTGQTSGKWGVVRDFTSTALKVILGPGSSDFAGSDVILDSPLKAGAARSFATISSITTATTALEDSNYIGKDVTNAANNIDKITSLVIAPGQRLIVESATQNNIFSLVGFEDNSTELTVRNYARS